MTAPAVAEISRLLYGNAVDPVEFAKSVDAADVHIDAPLVAAKRRKAKRGNAQLVPAPVRVAQVMTDPVQKSASSTDQRGRKAAAIGLGASGVASVAGIHALTATRGENAARRAKLLGEAPKVEEPGRAAVALTRRVGPKKAAAVLGGGLLGLHGVELVGDALAVHTQSQKLRQTKVAKGLKVSLKPVNPQQVPHPVSLRARRPGRSPSPVAKGLLRNVKGTAANTEEITRKVKALVPKPKTAALAGVGLVTASGVTGAAGTYEGAKRGVQRGLAKSFDAIVPIAKTVDERMQVFGWASVAVNKDGVHVVDRQGDVIPIGELEKAAYDYVQDSRVGGDQHRRISKWAFSTDLGPRQTATMIESMVFTPEKIEKMGLPGDFPQAWWVGYQIEDPAVWADIKSGKRTGFSIHGTGRRTPIGGDMVGVGKSLEETGPRPLPQSSPTRRRAVKLARRSSAKRQSLIEHHVRTFDSRTPIDTVLANERQTRRLSQIATRAGAIGLRKDLQLRERTRQAIHPPAVRRNSVESQAMRSIGYQPQTRKLDIEMRSRPEPYSYRVSQATADAVLQSPSKGKAYHAHIRNKAPHHTRYTVADRARLFRRPDQS